MDRGIEERDLGDLEPNSVQLVGLHEKGLWSEQHWDLDINTSFTNKLEQISMLISESGEFTFWIYSWRSLRDIKVFIWFFFYQNEIFKHTSFWFLLHIRISQGSHIIQVRVRCWCQLQSHQFESEKGTIINYNIYYFKNYFSLIVTEITDIL